MATQHAIQKILQMLEPKGLGNTPRALTHGSQQKRDEAIRHLILSWSLELADVSDEELLRAYVSWARTPQGKWWPQPAVLLEHCSGRQGQNEAEQAAVAAWNELWVTFRRHGCGPERPANAVLHEDYLQEIEKVRAKRAEVLSLTDGGIHALVVLRLQNKVEQTRGFHQERHKERLANVLALSGAEVRELVRADLDRQEQSARDMAKHHGPRWQWRCNNNPHHQAAARHTLSEMGGWGGLLTERAESRKKTIEDDQRRRWEAIFVRFLREAAEEAEAVTVGKLLDRAGHFGRSITERARQAAGAQPAALGGARLQLPEHLSTPEAEVVHLDVVGARR